MLQHWAIGAVESMVAEYEKAVKLWNRRLQYRRSGEALTLGRGLLIACLSAVDELNEAGHDDMAGRIFDYGAFVWERLSLEVNDVKMAVGVAGGYMLRGDALFNEGKYRAAAQRFERAVALWDNIVHHHGCDKFLDSLGLAHKMAAKGLSASGEKVAAFRFIARSTGVFERLVYEKRREEFSSDLLLAYMMQALVVSKGNDKKRAAQADSILKQWTDYQSRTDVRGMLAWARAELSTIG